MLGRLGEAEHKPTERTIREVYRFRLPEWDTTARLNSERMQGRVLKAAWVLARSADYQRYA